MATFTPADPNTVVDTRLLVAWREGFAIDTITGGGTNTLTVTDDLTPNDLVLTYSGTTTMTASGTTPGEGTFTSISVLGGGTLTGITPSNFGDIVKVNAYHIFDGNDTINGSSQGGDFLFAGYAGNDTLDGKGGGDSFRVSARPTVPILTITGASGADDTLFVEKNIFTGETSLDLRSSNLTSIDAITFLDPGMTVVISSSQFGAGVSSTATVGALSGTGLFDIFMDADGGTLDASGLHINANTTLRLFGANGAETISGTNGPDQFFGRAGADTLNGRGGDDTFFLESTNDEFDKINGGAGNDKVVASSTDENGPVLNGFNAAASSIEVWQGFVQGNAADNVFDFRGLKDQTAASAYFEVEGGAGNDTIFCPGFGIGVLGREGNDVIVGGKSTDQFLGGPGHDTLTGGGDSDTFYYFDVGDSVKKKALRDTITDFTAKSDKIVLAPIDANDGKKGDQAFKFAKHEGAEFDGKPGRLIFDQIDKAGTAHDVTVIYADTDGNQKADMAIQLTGLIDLHRGDFVL